VKRGRLIAIDGLDLQAVRTAAREMVRRIGAAHCGASHWDASAVFHELDLVDGAASPRTLLLLYAADLAFRVRWEIAPALAEGRTVVAAPYVATATAFGRAVGLERSWLANLLGFAPRPHASILEPNRALTARAAGFVGVACERWAAPSGIDRAALMREIARHLRRRAPRR
jgi:thymidylate kinase